MSYFPISHIVPQYVDSDGVPYSGAVLKAYASGTSTNISIAIDSAGATTATSIALNSQGFPEINGSIVIPYLDQDYKLALYPTQAAADSNTGALWTIDGVPISNIGALATTSETGTGDAYEISLTGVTSYETLREITFIASEANVGACTLNINSLGAKNIKMLDGTTPYDNAIVASMPVAVRYDGTNFVLMNPNAKQINDANGNEVLKTGSTASAVNELTVTNAATGNSPVISATGDDTNIDITLTAKGTGTVKNGAAVSGYVSGVTEYLEELRGAGDYYDLAALLTVPATFESFGPTGSGADNIWTDMDDIPAGAKFIKIKINVQATLSATPGFIIMLAKKTGETDTFGINQRIAEVHPPVTGINMSSINADEIPLDSSLRFDLALSWSNVSSKTSQGFLKGWVI